MSNTTDFDKLRKKRRRTQTVKRVSVLLVVVLALVGILSLNNLLVADGFVGRLRDFFGGMGGSGYPIPVPGGTLKEVKALEGDIAVLNDTNLYLYNHKGKELLNLQRMGENTILLTAGSRVLTYELGGTRYKIHSRTNLLYEGEHDYAITTMALGEQGDFAVVSASKQYTAQVTVFDARFEQLFQWSSNEMVAQVALHPRGEGLAAGCIGALGGVLNSAVYLFDYSSEKEIARVEFPGELVLHLTYYANTLGVLTDQGYHVMDRTGAVVADHSFSGERLVAARFGEGAALLLTESVETRSQSLLLIDQTGAQLGEITPGYAVRDMQVGRKVYLLHDQGITRYTRSLAEEESTPLSGAFRILLSDNRLYYFTAEEIGVLEERGKETPRTELSPAEESPPSPA